MLIKNGLVVDVAGLTASVRDVLIEDGRIAAVGPGLSGSPVIDASGLIVLPGFVDTHRHMWQTLVRSLAADVSLGQYIELVLRDEAPRLRPEDTYAGTLAGAVECLASGITTVQDYAGTPSFDHASASLDALKSSGIRALFGYGQPLGGDLPDAGDVAKAAELGNDLVSVMLAPLGPSFSSLDEVSRAWQLARSHDMRIAVHVGNGPTVGEPISLLRDNGLLGPDITFVHGNSLSDDELALIGSVGAGVSIAPAVEARMGHGGPVVGRLKRLGVTTGLGVDVVSAVAGDMFSLMRATLMSATFGDTHVTPGDVLRMATVDGAAALGMADRIGSIEAGKFADLVLLRANDVNLAGTRDVISAVVTAAHPGNVETVIVAGNVVRAS
ncbi:TRZ/ATZ family hydrolase [Lentzea sp. NBRC 105346]|uniref:amidohydrolase family protein n=1 Tax=Lentzea sp. NBRC 105346 TaxID=3032205 RepID=UPI0024A02B91|nr:amidohydrolase family protein [Lentzea sp. NBRC 105346]GLZ35897.1 TRZ/ATZ family hydrolase [Lentzea sp. NBRC 105346]